MPKTKAKNSAAAAGSTPGVPQTNEARHLHGTTNLSAPGPSTEPSASCQENEDTREPPGKRQAAASHRVGSEVAQTSAELGRRHDEQRPGGGGGGAEGGDGGGGGGGGIVMLPDDELIEVLRWLEVDELLEVAWTCRRWRAAVQDDCLWACTRFSACDGRALLRHFRMHGRTVDDHTGRWGRCSRAIDVVIGGGDLAALTSSERGDIALATAPPYGHLTLRRELETHPCVEERYGDGTPVPGTRLGYASKRPCSPLAPRRGAPSYMCRWVELDYVDKGEGVCYRLLRSVSCLQQLHHAHIVPLRLINLDAPHNSLQLFYEDAGRPLEAVLQERGKLPLDEVRGVLRQLLMALAHCHGQGVTHRNLKPKYVLLQPREAACDTAAPADGAEAEAEAEVEAAEAGGWWVKLSDFNSVRWLGAAMAAEDESIYGAAQVTGNCSPTVVTQPYRAPEILLGCTSYCTAIDMWACGCVFAEMCSGTMLFAGDSDIGQLFRIFDLLGTPGPGKAVPWPGVETLPYYSPLFPNLAPKPFASFHVRSSSGGIEHKLRELCASPLAEDLLRRMLTFDPRQRITAADALLHPFFTPPAPAAPLGAPDAADAAASAASAAAAALAAPHPAPSTAGVPPSQPAAAKQHRPAAAPTAASAASSASSAPASAASASASSASAAGQPCLLLELLPPAELAVLSRQISDPLHPQPAVRLSACARGLLGPMAASLAALRHAHAGAAALGSLLRFGARSWCAQLRAASELCLGERYARPLGLAHWAALGSLARAGALPALRELRISGCDTGDEGVALLAAGLRERGRLPALRCLYVNAAQVGPAGAAALAAALSARALPALDSLVLGGLVGGAGEAALAPALRGLPHLREVHLSATPINDADACASASTLAPAAAPAPAAAAAAALGAPAFVAASSLLAGPAASSAAAATATATAAATAAAIAAAATASIGRRSRAARGGSALTDGTVWSAWRLVEGSQREHSDICRRALPPQLVFERRAATLWIMRAAQEFCRCDRTAHLAAAVLELFIRRRAPPEPPQAGWASWVEEHALAALLLACKFQEVDIHMVDEFVTFGGERHDGAAILRAELDVCTALRMHLAIPTRLDFLLWTLQRLRWPTMYNTHRGRHEQVGMLAHYLVDVSLLCDACAAPPASLVASAALCLALAVLRCGRWRGGAPGPASAAEQYWAPSMEQATGFGASELRPVLRALQAEHEAVHAELGQESAEPLSRCHVLQHKCAHPRFHQVMQLPPFSPHAGGAVLLPRAPRTPGGHAGFD